jgi:hypothetical protein
MEENLVAGITFTGLDWLESQLASPPASHCHLSIHISYRKEWH